MKKKLSLAATILALMVGVLTQAETAQAACTWGPVSQSTNGTGVINSQLWNYFFAVYGQNQGSWVAGGYPFAYFWRNDANGAYTTGVHGGLYTTQLSSNGSFASIPKYYSNLRQASSFAVYPDAGHTKIAAIKVQIWYCSP